MDDQKDKNKIKGEKKPEDTKTGSKAEKSTPEEISRKKEEVLKRIDAEIGKEEEVEEAGSIEKKQVKEVPDETEKEAEEEVDGDAGKDSDSKSEDSSSQFTAAEFGMSDEGKKPRRFSNIALFLIVFLVVFLASALFYFLNISNVFKEKEEVVVELVPTEAPTPSPLPAFERSEVSVLVQNGSGKAGVAGKASEILVEKGYENVEAGNAEEFDYENVTIQLRSELEDYFDEIKGDLEDDYVVNDVYEELDEDSKYDIVIIIGISVEESDE